MRRIVKKWPDRSERFDSLNNRYRKACSLYNSRLLSTSRTVCRLDRIVKADTVWETPTLACTVHKRSPGTADVRARGPGCIQGPPATVDEPPTRGCAVQNLPRPIVRITCTHLILLRESRVNRVPFAHATRQRSELSFSFISGVHELIFRAGPLATD